MICQLIILLVDSELLLPGSCRVEFGLQAGKLTLDFLDIDPLDRKSVV